jgi:hypothetical protein
MNRMDFPPLPEAKGADDILEVSAEILGVGIGGEQTLEGTFSVAPQFPLIERDDFTLLEHETSVYHDAINCGSVLAKHELDCRIAEWHVIDVAKIEKDDVGFKARR